MSLSIEQDIATVPVRSLYDISLNLSSFNYSLEDYIH